MAKLSHIVQLCLRYLKPKEMCMLRCTCSELRDMSVSWQDHSIGFHLDGSFSAMSWLYKNIQTIQTLHLSIHLPTSNRMLHEVMQGGRSLVCLWVMRCGIAQLPPLPPKLQQLHVKHCSKLRALPALPATLRELSCEGCTALEELPSSLSGSALSKLNCGACFAIQRLPQLPGSLVDLQVNDCKKLLQLPALPDGLTRLYMHSCTSLTELPALPASLRILNCMWCSSLRTLPQLDHTSVTEVFCTGCSRMEQLPDMPDSLVELYAAGLRRLSRLPRLPADRLKQLQIRETAISELPSSLPLLENLSCGATPIQQLPALPSCRNLYFKDSAQLQQLPELPAGLTVLNCRGCSALQQLPDQLPPKLEYLYLSDCTALQQLPELPATLQELDCEGCSSLPELLDLTKCQAQGLSLNVWGGVSEIRVAGFTLQLPEA